MSTFVLLGARAVPHAEVCPASLGADIARATSFVDALRSWRLLDYYATGPAEADQPRAVLVLHASGPAAAAGLAAAWSKVTGFDVRAWPLVAARRGCAA